MFKGCIKFNSMDVNYVNIPHSDTPELNPITGHLISFKCLL